MVNKRGLQNKDDIMYSIRAMMKFGEYEDARIELFKFNNLYNMEITDKYFGLYNLAYCYDELGDKKTAKYYINEAMKVFSGISNEYPDKYSMVANMSLYLQKDEMTTFEQVIIYRQLYEANKDNEEEGEFVLNILSTIYVLEDRDEELLLLFEQCYNNSYINVCKSILNNKTIKNELKAEMQLLYNRKQEMIG